MKVYFIFVRILVGNEWRNVKKLINCVLFFLTRKKEILPAKMQNIATNIFFVLNYLQKKLFHIDKIFFSIQIWWH